MTQKGSEVWQVCESLAKSANIFWSLIKSDEVRKISKISCSSLDVGACLRYWTRDQLQFDIISPSVAPWLVMVLVNRLYACKINQWNLQLLTLPLLFVFHHEHYNFLSASSGHSAIHVNAPIGMCLFRYLEFHWTKNKTYKKSIVKM